MIMMQYHLILLQIVWNKLIWNKDDNINNPYAKEILNNDLVLSIEDLNEPYEVYAYSFFKVHKSELGNKAYQLTKIVLDSEMSDDFIKYRNYLL